MLRLVICNSLLCCLIILHSNKAHGGTKIQGKTYHVDAVAGDDQSDGSKPEGAWKSLKPLEQQKLRPGDSVLLKRGSTWQGTLTIKDSGSKGKLIYVGAYGEGELPKIEAAGAFQDALLIHNASFIHVESLDLSNLDPSVNHQQNGPTGVRIWSENFGTMEYITLKKLYIHDINGDNKKGSKEGHGIYWECEGPQPSNIAHLLIDSCNLERVDRNGIRGNGTFGTRDNWFPNKDLIVRNCHLQDIGGDGIVIKSFDQALIERNKLLCIRTRAKDNAVAIWPHSSDNTVIQYNEVGFTQNRDWSNDGQSFDVDGNCQNTLIQYNYSHDNEGGFMLVISDAINKKSWKTKGVIIRNNLSVNDGLNRKRLFNFAVTVDSVIIENNLFFNNSPDSASIEVVDIEHGLPTNVCFKNNIFQFNGETTAIFSKQSKQYEATTWFDNIFEGRIKNQQAVQQCTK